MSDSNGEVSNGFTCPACGPDSNVMAIGDLWRCWKCGGVYRANGERLKCEQRGQVNAYYCGACGRHTITINAADGVTPFMIGCRATPGCNGQARSMFYRVPQTTFPHWEWHVPEPAEWPKLGRETIAHIFQGGMILRRLDVVRLESFYRFRRRLRHG